MLISFSVANFLSFKELQTVDFTPDPLRDHQDHLHIPYLYDADTRILKSVVLYGYNSTGKSNFIKAYKFFLDFIRTSFSPTTKFDEIQVDSFRLNTATTNLPSCFEAIFLIRETKYRYGFKTTKETITEEWLWYAEAKTRENFLFDRQEQHFRINKAWNKEADGEVETAKRWVKPHILFLSILLAQESIPRMSDLDYWLNGNVVLSNFSLDLIAKQAAYIFGHQKYRPLINKFIESADLGIESIDSRLDSAVERRGYDRAFINLIFAREISAFNIYTKHRIFSEELKRYVETLHFELLKNESTGTIKFFYIACHMAWAINEGFVIFIDELDASLHSSLLTLVVALFNSNRINKQGCQLLYTSHNTVLLDKKLRRDQIFLAEKDDKGESKIRRMHTADTPIRKDTKIEQEYRKGKMGGSSKKVHDLTIEFESKP